MRFARKRIFLPQRPLRLYGEIFLIFQTRIQDSQNASSAVLILCPATSRGTGLPGKTRPFTVMVAL